MKLSALAGGRKRFIATVVSGWKARAGSKSTFKEGRDDPKVYAGIRVSAKDLERVAEGIGEQMENWSKRQRHKILSREQTPQSQKRIPILYVSYDGTGVPMTKVELYGRKGKQADGSARTREVKLGCSTKLLRSLTSTTPVGMSQSSARICSAQMNKRLCNTAYAIGPPWTKAR